MSRSRITVAAIVFAAFSAVCTVVPPAALGYSRGIHDLASDRAAEVMEVYGWMNAIVNQDVYATPRAKAGCFSFFPLLALDAEAAAVALVSGAANYDAYVGDMGTRNHFWTADEDLDEEPEGVGGLNNAWEMARAEWWNALYWYRHDEIATSMWYLGHVLHLVEDMGQPAHTNSDLHGPGNRDSLEEWGGYDTLGPWYSWTDSSKTSPGQFFRPWSNQSIINRVTNRTAWAGRDEFMADATLMDPNDPNNTAQLFQIMYMTNQWANYFASDGESGDKIHRLGWVDYETLGFPKYLHAANGGHVPAQAEEALDDNEGACDHPGSTDEYCDADGDLTTIAKWGYAASMKGAGAVIELFRRTIDSTPPVTDVELTKSDGGTYALGTWTNKAVTVHFASATDPGSHPTGVWTMYGQIDGKAWGPSEYVYPISHLQTTFGTTGTRTVTVLTTDNAGNIEKRDIVVRVDTVPPDVSFAAWRQLLTYYPCEKLQLRWALSDADSGPKLSTGTLDGKPVVVNEYVDLMKLPLNSIHTLQVLGYDKASNRSIEELRFSLIDHGKLYVGRPLVRRLTGGVRYQFTGTLTPKHWKGTTPVTLVISKRRTDGSWVIKQKVKGGIQADGTYKALATITAAGKYRVRAEHYVPKAYSPYRYFKIAPQ